VHEDQRVGPGIRQRLQQHRVHHTEYRRVGTDAERQGEDRREGETWLPQKAAHAVSKVLKNAVHTSAHDKAHARCDPLICRRIRAPEPLPKSRTRDREFA
jgi:ribosomal protein L22